MRTAYCYTYDDVRTCRAKWAGVRGCRAVVCPSNRRRCTCQRARVSARPAAASAERSPPPRHCQGRAPALRGTAPGSPTHSARDNNYHFSAIIQHQSASTAKKNEGLARKKFYRSHALADRKSFPMSIKLLSALKATAVIKAFSDLGDAVCR